MKLGVVVSKVSKIVYTTLQNSEVMLSESLLKHGFGIIEFFGLSIVGNHGSSIDFQ